MKRRAKGEGSVYFWDAKELWVGQITLPDGKRRTKYGHTQKEVKDWLLAERGKISQGTYIPDEKITVAGFLRQYLEDHGKRTLRATTLTSYTDIIERHIIPEIGKLRLTQLRADHLNHLYSKKLSSNLSDRTVEYIHGVLRRALNRAVKWGLIAKNPTDMASPPSVKFKTPSTWTGEQVKQFLEQIRDDRWAGIYYLACGVGMRKGEILGLPLSALDLEKGYLKVTQSLQYIPSRGLNLLDPKTDKSRRMIVLPSFVVEALKAHLARRERLSQGPHWKESGLVFTTDIGTPISPRNLLRHFKTKLTEAGLPEIRFHDLRHTTASLLLEKNVHPKIVSELLGHSSITLTLNTYSHIINPMGRVAADAMDEAVGRK
jgi:integrase